MTIKTKVIAEPNAAESISKEGTLKVYANGKFSVEQPNTSLEDKVQALLNLVEMKCLPKETVREVAKRYKCSICGKRGYPTSEGFKCIEHLVQENSFKITLKGCKEFPTAAQMGELLSTTYDCDVAIVTRQESANYSADVEIGAMEAHEYAHSMGKLIKDEEAIALIRYVAAHIIPTDEIWREAYKVVVDKENK